MKTSIIIGTLILAVAACSLFFSRPKDSQFALEMSKKKYKLQGFKTNVQYTISQIYSSLNLKATSEDENAVLQLDSNDKSDKFKFYVWSNNTNGIEIVNVKSGKALKIYDDGTQIQGLLVQTREHGTINQAFQFLQDGQIKHVLSGKCLRPTGYTNALIVLGPCYNDMSARAQTWTFSEVA